MLGKNVDMFYLPFLFLFDFILIFICFDFIMILSIFYLFFHPIFIHSMLQMISGCGPGQSPKQHRLESGPS